MNRILEVLCTSSTTNEAVWFSSFIDLEKVAMASFSENKKTGEQFTLVLMMGLPDGVIVKMELPDFITRWRDYLGNS